MERRQWKRTYGPMLRALLCAVLTMAEASAGVVMLVGLASFTGVLEFFWVPEYQLYDCTPLLAGILLLVWACWELNVHIIM